LFNPFKIVYHFFIYLARQISPLFKKKTPKIEIDDKDEEILITETPKPQSKPQDYKITLSTEEPEVFEPPIVKKTPVYNPALKNQSTDEIKYQKPDIDSFLYKPSIEKRLDKVKLETEIKETSKILVDKLAEFGIEATVLNVNVGPIITQYELDPAPGIKVNRFTSLSDDLALALKAKSIRVQAPIPGRGLIGVEIPNRISDVIYMRDIFFSSEMYQSDAILSVALGKDIAGRPIVTDLAKMPHLLIAGATGSGKSVCINTIICSLLLRCTPEEVRLAMIDPKRIELSGYEGIPHLIQSVVTEPEDAMNTLNWAVYEMERRYELLQELKVREITSYNQKISEMVANEEAEEIDKLPYIILVVDEFADLIMTAGREIEQPIARLAQMARAVGIHIILATQRPSIKVITGVIKANFPARIAFRVSSKVDSRVILDVIGADKLLGRGDMLFMPPGKGNPERIHGAFLSDSEIEGLVEYLRTQPKPRLDIQMNKPEAGNINEFEYDDELFPEAARVVVRSNTASVSMLQRHFKIGYARAGRLVDLLEQAGVIGPHLGSKPREVLMTKEDVEGFGESEKEK
jgi:S-DNA-T family DNA segregation ATPase FtsK/SpoIIIE